jgi:BirA family transcriptional regulator, biotin operon repressor / biotin---[acetyl-CoA-carboxylase] ligase
VGGVLCESAWEGETPRFVVVGIGVNVLQGEGELPLELRGRATWLALASGRAPDRREVAGALAVALAELARLGAGELDAAEARELERRDALRGRRVAVEQPSGTLQGTVLGIGPTGALLLRDPQQRVHELTAGSPRLLDPSAG